jgi:nucleoside-diphosphate-sugar epimerase
MSTAFVAGRRDGICAEAIEDPPGFCNSYEASKLEAEKMVLDFGRRHDVRAYVHRPSIIVGDSVRGRTLIFNAMYYPVRFSRYILDLLRMDIDQNDGQLAAEMGVHLHEDGTLEVPVRLDTGPPGGGVLNLVPIDFVVEAVLAVLASDAEPGIYHLVNKRPSSVADLAAYTARYFRLTGPAACPSEAFLTAPKTALEQRFEKDLEIYRPYLRDTRLFDTTRADRVLEAAGVCCPPFDYELFRRCIDYALACDWRPLSSAHVAPEPVPAG